MSQNDNYVVVPGVRRMGAGSVILISMLTSIIVSSVTVYALLRVGGAPILSAPAAAPAQTTVQVPDLSGIKSEAADELLAAKNLRLVVGERREHEAEPGTVIAQIPLPKSRVEAGSQVSVVISAGTEGNAVPAVIGMTAEEANAAIQNAGLTLGPSSTGEGGAPGTVLAAVPAVGTRVAPGSAVALTIAEEPGVQVPNVLGERIHGARERLKKAGLSVGDVKEKYDSRRKGYVVLEQTPAPGTKAPAGTAVSLVINQGD